MRRSQHITLAGMILVLGMGCASDPRVDVPGLVPGEQLAETEQNPVYIPMGSDPFSYGKAFENVLQVLGDYGFEIQESNRYDGWIETIPRISPGLALFLRPGSPAFRDRLLSTLQTYRHRISVIIQPADNGGLFVEVVVRKELQDLARPIKATAGAAIFRVDNNIERQFEVVDPVYFDSAWIFKGRDTPLEQKIIHALKKLM